MTGGGSVVVRRQLGVRLRKLRETARKELSDVVESGIGSKAKISRIENGRLPVKMADIRALCWLYGADQATTDALAAMAPGTQQDDWWEQYGQAVVPEWFGLYAGLEATASRIRGFEPDWIRGLLQTPEYAAAIIGADPRIPPEVVEQGVRFRLERQRAVFDNEPAANVIVVMGEGALVCGPPDILEPQIVHMRSLSERPNIDVRVLPFSAGMYPQRGSFMLLDFDDDEDPSVAYVEVPMGARYFDRPDERADYEYVFDIILSKSTPIKEWKPWPRPRG